MISKICILIIFFILIFIVSYAWAAVFYGVLLPKKLLIFLACVLLPVWFIGLVSK